MPPAPHSGQMDPELAQLRTVWETASSKYVREDAELMQRARDGKGLAESELELLRPLLRAKPRAVHLQSGNGLDDLALVRAGAQSVVGVDFSEVAAAAAQERAQRLLSPCRYVVGVVPGVPLREECADLVYTGKGALIWLADLDAWATDVVRLLRPGGHLLVHEAHPAVPLWSWDGDEARIRPDRSYFARSHVNDSFPGRGAVERQWTLGEVVTAVVTAGLEVRYLAEHPDPFWRPDEVDAAAWRGRLPNTYTLLCRRPTC